MSGGARRPDPRYHCSGIGPGPSDRSVRDFCQVAIEAYRHTHSLAAAAGAVLRVSNPLTPCNEIQATPVFLGETCDSGRGRVAVFLWPGVPVEKAVGRILMCAKCSRSARKRQLRSKTSPRSRRNASKARQRAGSAKPRQVSKSLSRPRRSRQPRGHPPVFETADARLPEGLGGDQVPRLRAVRTRSGTALTSIFKSVEQQTACGRLGERALSGSWETSRAAG